MNFEAISAWLRNALLPYGGFGLMALAVCDSSFISLPEVNDVLLMTFAINEPDAMVKFALLTTLGSVIGCALLYAVGRKGGEAFLRRSIAHERLARVRRWYQRHGVLAVIVPSLLPPPTPFKIFVLSAGTFGISSPQFPYAVVMPRIARYFSEGSLSVKYLSPGIPNVQRNLGKNGLVGATNTVACGVVF